MQVSRLLSVILVAGLSACMIVRAPSKEELHALDHPPEQLAQTVDQLTPKVIAWFEELESAWQHHSRALTENEVKRARRVGVRHPEKVRVAISDQLPLPKDPELLQAARRYGLGGKNEGGRTHGYLIILKPSSLNYPEILQHELVHVAQGESLGLHHFVRRYLTELEMLGYARSPLELQAYAQQELK